jgi:hypothetical protein
MLFYKDRKKYGIFNSGDTTAAAPYQFFKGLPLLPNNNGFFIFVDKSTPR